MTTPHAPLDLEQSVAGEEDPGASIDIDQRMPAKSGLPSAGGGQLSGGQAPMSPGDQAPAGTPGTGEAVCAECGGTGKRAGRDCPACQGTGKVTIGIGGG